MKETIPISMARLFILEVRTGRYYVDRQAFSMAEQLCDYRELQDGTGVISHTIVCVRIRLVQSSLILRVAITS